jgi:hypothetical protein
VRTSKSLPGDPSIPPDWSWYANALGYRVAVPTTWLMVAGDPTMCLYDGRGQRFLFMNQWTSNSKDAVKALLTREVELSTPGGMPLYHRLAINPVTCAAACAELEFTFDGPLGRLHGIVWDYVMPSGEAYTVTWMTTIATWGPNLVNFGRVVSTFTVTE